MKQKSKNQKKINLKNGKKNPHFKRPKSMEEIILDFQRKNIDRISFKPEGRTPLRFPLAEDLKKEGYIHVSKVYPLIRSMNKTIATLKIFKKKRK